MDKDNSSKREMSEISKKLDYIIESMEDIKITSKVFTRFTIGLTIYVTGASLLFTTLPTHKYDIVLLARVFIAFVLVTVGFFLVFKSSRKVQYERQK